MVMPALPKTLGIEEICKGYFPHLLNNKNPINEDTGRPDAYFYQPAHMKPNAYYAFMDWYKNKK